MNKKIFLSTPISGFKDRALFSIFRKKIISITTFLEKNDFEVCSEINKFSIESDYDTPDKSIQEDFKKIREADIFLMFHPQKMQTSTLIELGYACAFNRKIIIVGNKNDLPYLAKGIEDSEYSAKLVNILDFSKITEREILDAILLMI